MSPKAYYHPPEPFDNDINHEARADCRELDTLVFACIHIASAKIESHLQERYPDIAKHMFSEFLEKMKETHEVIRQIYKEYAKEEKPHQIAALPLARQQIESLFTLVICFRRPDLFPLYERASFVNIYKRFVYETTETKNLERFKESNVKRRNLLEEWMQGKGPILKPFTKEELKAIEDFVLNSIPLKGFDRWPSPKQIITMLAEKAEDEPLAKTLLRLYVEYEWLSGYVHSDLWAATSRASLKYNHPTYSKSDFSEREVRDPILLRSYVSMLIGTTVASQHITELVTLRAKLSEVWQLFEKSDFIGMYAWNTYAKNALGILSI